MRKLESWAIVWHCLLDGMFSHFKTVLSCDRQTEGDTHGDGIYHTSIASHGIKPMPFIPKCFVLKQIEKTEGELDNMGQ